MSSNLSQNPPPNKKFQIHLQGCPDQLLKSVENLKKIGLTHSIVEFQFKDINDIQIFTRILNRQEQQEKVANELKVTFFHNIRGKIRKVQLVKNESFISMKRIRFNSVYHATLFLKFYSNRIFQMENEYKYSINCGKDGCLNVYINQQNLSSMFLNQIRDMKKSLQFLEIKDYSVCQRFINSLKTGNELRKIGIFHQVWYKGRQSTIIFYSNKYNLIKMKSLITAVNKYHITIFKMIDYRSSFLLNYMMFKLIKKSISECNQGFETAQNQQIQFNQDKLSLVIHDIHQLFSKQIKQEVLQKMKHLFLISIKSKDSRKFYNYLKKLLICQNFLNFNYSKKVVSLCIKKSKISDMVIIKNIFYFLGQCCDQQSQITINWFHLQDNSLQKYRQNLIQNFGLILSNSVFHVQNFQKFIENKDLKCILKYKNMCQDRDRISQKTSEILTSLIDAWDIGRVINKIDYVKKEVSNKELNESKQQGKQKIEENSSLQSDESQQQSQYEQDNHGCEQKVDVEEQQGEERCEISEEVLIDWKGMIKEQVQKRKIRKFEVFEMREGEVWKQSKSLKGIEDMILEKGKIVCRIKLVCLHQRLKQEWEGKGWKGQKERKGEKEGKGGLGDGDEGMKGLAEGRGWIQEDKEVLFLEYKVMKEMFGQKFMKEMVGQKVMEGMLEKRRQEWVGLRKVSELQEGKKYMGCQEIGEGFMDPIFSIQVLQR